MFPDTVDNIGPAYVGPVPPAYVAPGDLWADTTDPLAPVLKVYVAGVWYPAVPPAAVALRALPVRTMTNPDE